MTSPSGAQYPIASCGYHAVVTESGATLRELDYDGTPLLLGFDEDRLCSKGRGQVLMPWPNRIRDGRYSFEGARQQLPLSEAGRSNASHGLVRWTSWRPLERDESGVTLGYRLMAQSGYPWTLDLQVDYRLSEFGLTATMQARNVSDGPAPFAAGAHPYLLGPVDDTELGFGAGQRLLVDPERLLPTGGLEPVAGSAHDFTAAHVAGDLVLDDAVTGLARDDDGLVRVRFGRTTLWADDQFGWLQLFSLDDGSAEARTALAVEPMTAPPDAFNSGTDLRTLAPDEEWTGRWGISVEASS